MLPIELSRLSSNRAHFTYVVDPHHGTKVPTRYGISTYGDLEDAIADLACREGCRASAIGFVLANDSDTRRARNGVPCDELQEWAKRNQFDGVIWTDLEPKWPKQWPDWSIERAVNYWRNEIPADRLANAAAYAGSAPPEVDTALRQRLAAEGLIVRQGSVEITDSRQHAGSPPNQTA